jgi:iron(III) transport system substrate-binding protein
MLLTAGCGAGAPSATPGPSSAAAVSPSASAAAKPAASGAPGSASASAQAPTTPEAIFAYTGADRQQMLEDGARKEGKVLWYTSEILDQRARPLAETFRKKYPFIDVQIVQLDNGPLVQRATEEFNAKKYDLDIIEGGLVVALPLKGMGALAKFVSPEFSAIPAGARDPDGYFVGDREIPLGFGYNTKITPEAQGPKSFDDLLAPAWKGKLSTNDSTQGATYFGGILQQKGEDFARKLATQNVIVESMSSNAVNELVAAGTVASTFPTSVGQVAFSRKAGAPIAWSPLGKAITLLGVIDVMSHSPHPHAAALYADFLISDEGQKALVQTQEGGTRIGLQNQYGGYEFEKLYFDTSVPQSEYVGDIKKWAESFNSILAKRPA